MVSIVVPCFNDGRFLGDAIESAEANQSGNYEIIIVNDGSTDAGTLELLKTIESRGHQVIHQENRGLGFSRNVGIAAARGAYILPLDADNRIDFDVGNHYTSTHPASPFVNRLMLRALTDDASIVVMNRSVKTVRADAVVEATLADRAALRALLHVHFGFDLPEVLALRVPTIDEWQ